MTETFQITREQAAAYEELFVPALFAQWAPMMADLARVREGHRVLDVACGTGIAARAAADRVGGSGSVVGLDLNPAMLEVAARIRPDIEWRQGDASELPFGDESFDAVLCQSAVFFFPDVDQSFSEMARVIRRGGVVAIQTYAALADQPAYREFDVIVRRITRGEALDLLDTYWSMGDLPALCAALNRAGLRIVETRTTQGTVRYGTVDNLVQTEIKGTPLADRLSQSQIDQILAESASILNSFVTPERGLEMPITSHLVAARRPG
jgi:SAM-dependent methyltransferase